MASTTGSASGLDLFSLEVFLSVLDLGSVSKAARRHDLSQPSVTARLHRLEAELGVTLLERTPTGSVGTPAGRSLARDARRLLDAADDLREVSRQLRTDAAASIRVGAVDGLAPEPLGRWVNTWDWPRAVTIELERGTTVEIADAVRRGRVDVGFVDGPSEPVGLGSATVATDRIVAVVGPRHRWAGLDRRIDLDDLLAEPLVHTARGTGSHDTVEHVLGDPGGGLDGRVVGSHDEALVAATVGVEVALVPERCRPTTLRPLELAGTPWWQTIRVTWRGRRPERNAARAFVDHLRFGPTELLPHAPIRGREAPTVVRAAESR